MQRQLRLGDTLDDYCPRERRVTNHAVVAMLGEDVKQTRCTTCDAEHEYKQAKVPRQRRKSETPAALYAAVLAGGPKVVAHPQEPQKDAPVDVDATHAVPPAAHEPVDAPAGASHAPSGETRAEAAEEADAGDVDGGDDRSDDEEGPVHRPLIRASLPRTEGQPPPQRQAPDFTIRQPGGRPSRFRPRHLRGGAQFQSHGNRANGNGNSAGGPPRGGMPRHPCPLPPQGALPRQSRRNGPGRKRSK
jgi:hypothetical protein